jgi:hypothetical protein
MTDSKGYTVGELMELLKEYPDDMPVIVSGYESGYEYFCTPTVRKVKHFPENKYWDGEFQLDDNGSHALILERKVRDS